MKAYLISDLEFQTPLLEQVESRVKAYLAPRGFDIEETRIGERDLVFCKGCFGCWTKKPGECTINDAMARINHTAMNSDVVVYLSPVVFGQFSANLKNAIDRWLPNMLPFFMTRKDGSTMHPPRYDDYPAQIMVGYADELSAADAQLFTDINRNHRSRVEVMIYRGPETEVEAFLDQIELKREGGPL
ncbi:MAG: NAD(P)H-dependent oxidoreductase [Solirubrobacterales bacterium]